MNLHSSLSKVLTDSDLISLLNEVESPPPPKVSPLDLSLQNIKTVDRDMLALKAKIRQLAAKNISVLIIGETGTGKELVAKALHGNRESPFLAINTAGVPDTLLESEFFGAKKGAYTGCDKDRVGYLEEVKDGTLFLDEIGDMPVLLQAKLLRVIENRTARRLGDVREYPVNCRFVAATNQVSLADRRSSFRKDLYYRLAGTTLQTKPLSCRFCDIEILVKEFCKSSPSEVQTKILNQVEIKTLKGKGYSWPGNVRELKNYVEEVEALTEVEENQYIFSTDNNIHKFGINPTIE